MLSADALRVEAAGIAKAVDGARLHGDMARASNLELEMQIVSMAAEIVERLDILIAQDGQSGPRSGEVYQSPMDRLKRGESLRGES